MEPGKKKILSILIAVIMVSGVFTYVLVSHNSPRTVAPKPSVNLGPRAVVSVGSTMIPPSYNDSLPSNTTISIQIFSVVPQGFTHRNTLNRDYLGNLNSQNNSYYDTLINASLNSTRSILFLSPTFGTIASEWRPLLSNNSGKSYPSLTIEAHKTVYQNNSAKIYSYYNNMQYDPLNVGTHLLNQSILRTPYIGMYFNNSSINPSQYSSITVSNISFNISLKFPHTPSQVLTNIKPDVEYSPSCPTSTSYYWKTVTDTYDNVLWVKDVHGAVPLVILNAGPGTDNSLSTFALAASVEFSNTMINLNSVQPYVSVNGQVSTTMSSTPSFSHIGNASFDNGINELTIYPYNTALTGQNATNETNQTTGYVGIQNATYTFTHYDQNTSVYHNEYKEVVYTRYYNDQCLPYKEVTTLVQSNLVSTTYDGNLTSAEISWINSTASLQVTAQWAPVELYQLISQKLDLTPTASLDIYGNSNNGPQSYQSSTIWSDYTGYTTATTELNDIVNGLTDFSTALSMGLAIITVAAALNGGSFDAAEPTVVATALGLIATFTGFAAFMLSQFSSISYMSKSTSAIVDWGFSEAGIQGHPDGSDYSFTFYQGSNPVTLNVNGNSYSFSAPEDYINVTNVIT